MIECGAENFTVEVIEECETQEELAKKLGYKYRSSINKIEVDFVEALNINGPERQGKQFIEFRRQNYNFDNIKIFM